MRLFINLLTGLLGCALLAVSPAAAQQIAHSSEAPEKPGWRLAPEGEISRAEIEVEAVTEYDGRYQLTENLQIYLIRTGETWSVDAMRSEEVTASPGAGGDWTKSVSRQASFPSHELAEKILNKLRGIHTASAGGADSEEFGNRVESSGNGEESSPPDVQLEVSRKSQADVRLTGAGAKSIAEFSTGEFDDGSFGLLGSTRANFVNSLLLAFGFEQMQNENPEAVLSRLKNYETRGLSSQRNVSTNSNYSENYESKGRKSSIGEDSDSDD